MSEYSVKKKGRLLTLIRFLDSIKKISYLTPKNVCMSCNKRCRESLFPIEWLFGPGTPFTEEEKRNISYLLLYFSNLQKTINISHKGILRIWNILTSWMDYNLPQFILLFILDYLKSNFIGKGSNCFTKSCLYQFSNGYFYILVYLKLRYSLVLFIKVRYGLCWYIS